MRAYYEKFERHAHGQGVKGHSSHYCAGCGHGLIHNYLAEAINELGIQERTVAVSPVGCSVFLYYYMDVGNTQAPHGRAPMVALGQKMANPEAIVISYQGDGDLGSIGLAEIMHAAQLGLPISVIFVNNAIYGMTGGQLAPTTLMGQKTQTSPNGRRRLDGQPMKIAELMAQLDGPVYVERVALFDAKQRVKTKKAIKKALQLQVENKGFSFVEILSECPTHLKMSPTETEKWVQECMLPVYPLGVKKDLAGESWFQLPKPQFDPERMINILHAEKEENLRFAKTFPTHIDPVDIALKFAGAGGDGAQTAAMLVTQSAIFENFDGTHIPSYGPESRGGTSYADVHVAKDQVLSPASSRPHILVVFNSPSLVKFAPTVVAGGYIIYDSTVIKDVPQVDPTVKLVGVPFTQIATDLGKKMVKNIVALGALQAATQIFPAETLLTTIRKALADKSALIPVNEKAFALGAQAVVDQAKARQ